MIDYHKRMPDFVDSRLNPVYKSDGNRQAFIENGISGFCPGKLCNGMLLRAKALKKTAKLLHFAAFLASPARFERTAFRLGGERSILLSYGDKTSDILAQRRLSRKVRNGRIS